MTTTAGQLTTEIESIESEIRSKTELLTAASAQVEDSEIAAILSGRKSEAPALKTKVRSLQADLALLREKLAPRRAALARIEAEETTRQAEAEKSRLESLRSQHKAAVGTLIQTIIDGTSIDAIREAELSVAALQGQFPFMKEGPRELPERTCPEIRVPDALGYRGVGRDEFLENLCHSGYVEFFAADHISRRRYEHGMQYEKGERERRTKERAHRQALADASLIPDDQAVPYFGGGPNR